MRIKVATPGHTALGLYKTALPPVVEQGIHDHLQSMEKSLHGFTARNVCRLPFNVASKAGCSCPFSEAKGLAGKDRLTGFFKRFPDLSLRDPEASSVARHVGFNGPEFEAILHCLPGHSGVQQVHCKLCLECG